MSPSAMQQYTTEGRKRVFVQSGKVDGEVWAWWREKGEAT